MNTQENTQSNAVATGRAHKSTTHEERFYHIREEFDYNGKRMKGATVFFRKELPYGGWYYSVSRCSATDNWNKAVGRTVARRRYFGGEVDVPAPAPEPSYENAKALAYKKD